MIVTERLVLTPSAISDFDDCNAMRTDPEVMHFIGGVASAEDTWIRLLRNVGHWTAFGYGLFTLREKDGGRFVGEGGLAHFRRGLGDDFDDFPEGAWALASAAHGKGYGTEALEAVHAWFFAQRGKGRAVCLIDPENRPSVRMGERLGYRPFRQATYRDKPMTLFERAP
ncbi:GNAT family N-acetyltransferase [Luteibacter sp. UNCMF366Tsu5.1]|uniref:GNAT family N-acetyltransferase n=1 Tax=Luteibacter sp. UNCMF366Tsu5.1 TaxID=1502758 RepID=UPI00090903A1|nr:GNAT family N-acetyltransferase [Luteibacter sp. UNCMF366Tsu5.1]SFW41626.1 Protein N-acetyltransferase, RimJ/RimL family [Luteibacter sp. UNCMF366Tsu5.1]